MKSIWTIADWWWWLVDTVGGKTARYLERWYWQAAMHVNHWKWLVRCWRMRYWSWYFRVMPDSVTLALGAIFAFCAAAAILFLALIYIGIWQLIVNNC